MASQAQPVERLREYLRQLPPQMCAQLLAKIELDRLNGDDTGAADLVLGELRDVVNENENKVRRITNPLRLFIKPIEPFLVDVPRRGRIGRLARQSLAPIWTWICRGPLAAEAKDYCEIVKRALLADNAEAAERRARDFQDRAVKFLVKTLAAASKGRNAQLRLAGEIGLPHACDDLSIMTDVLKARDALADLGLWLPDRIDALQGERLAATKSSLEAFVSARPDAVVYALLLVMMRLAQFWQLICMAIEDAGSRAIADIEKSRFAPAVALVMADVAELAAQLQVEAEEGKPQGIARLLDGISGATAFVRNELDMPEDSSAARTLASVEVAASEFLKARLETALTSMAQLLRPTRLREGNEDADRADMATAERALALFALCEAHASHFGLSRPLDEARARLRAESHAGVTALLEGFRGATDAERRRRLWRVAAAVRLSRQHFEPAFSTRVLKSVEAAIGAGSLAA